jgi:hypothetical protein
MIEFDIKESSMLFTVATNIINPLLSLLRARRGRRNVTTAQTFRK